jgi:Tfp pilus assembly protein PilO
MNNVKLQAQRGEKEDQLQNLKKSKRVSETMQEELVQLKLEAAKIEKKIPRGDEMSFGVIKEIYAVGEKIGLRNLTFTLNDEVIAGAGAMPAVKPKRNKNNNNPAPAVNASSVAIKITPLTISFECQFVRLISFLEKIYQMDRVVTVVDVKAQRIIDILPYQKVTLNILSYNFNE